MKRAGVSKLSGTGECPITLCLNCKHLLILIWIGLFLHPGIIRGSRVICQALQEHRDLLDFF